MTKLTLPKVLYSNTYFWHPATNAGTRRSNEQYRAAEVEQFEAQVRSALGEEASAGVGIDFSYSESCSHVYKHAGYRVPGKDTNLTGFVGYCKRNGIEIVK